MVHDRNARSVESLALLRARAVQTSVIRSAEAFALRRRVPVSEKDVGRGFSVPA